MREVVIVLNNIRSTHNVGAIMRTCEGAGVTKLYLCGITPTPPHPKILKTALGAEDMLSWEYQKEIAHAIENLKKESYEIISIEQTDSSVEYYKYDPSDKVAFILGNEISGVDPEVLALSDKVLELPMMGKKKSLNVSTTTGIIAYHFKFI